MKRNFARAFAGQLFRSVFAPAYRNEPITPIRALVGLPIIFDIASLILQALDYRRLRLISQKKVAVDPHHIQVHEYNAGVTTSKVFTSTRRYEFIYKLLSLPPRDKSCETLLIVGPRNRAELLMAWVHGFIWKNIYAIDLYSTNPKILEMNMEAMTWSEATFDNASMACTLSYAKDTSAAISEIARVLKPSGLFAFTVSYLPEKTRWKESQVDGHKIAELLHHHGFKIEIHQVKHMKTSNGSSQSLHSFMARKINMTEVKYDQFSL